ncbi:host attachment protein [Massilia sp. TN1-12]|uniref:host attachment protein n=1 Tax=Massilia paldalensis TaxID=3377675 RepID=UPI00384C3B71
MTTTWIVSADAGRARIFAESDPHQPYEEIEDMVSPNARLRVSDINTDRLGPTSAGQSIHNTGGATPNKQYEPAQTPEQRDAEFFAKEICGFLLKGQQEKRFGKLVLVAEPKFLGVLRGELDNQLKPAIALEVNKDYSHSNGQQLREQLQAYKAKQ